MTSPEQRSRNSDDLLEPASPRHRRLPSLDWLYEDDLMEAPEPPSHPSPQSTTSESSDANFIDLTADSSPPPRMRPVPHTSAPAWADQEPARKRRRIAEDLDPRPSSSLLAPEFRGPTQSAPATIDAEDANIEEVDLTRVEDGADLRRHREDRERQKEVEEQQRHLLNESINAQASSNSGTSKFTQLSCIICMETMTDVTATHCGHIFCHTCIMEALIAGENQGAEPGKGQSRCPVCRKKVARKLRAKAQPEVIPLELKLKTKSEKSKGKEPERTAAVDDPPIGD